MRKKTKKKFLLNKRTLFIVYIMIDLIINKDYISDKLIKESI